MLDQALQDVLALGMFGIDRDRPLVAVEHREIEAVLALPFMAGLAYTQSSGRL
jgi:hypothetical protein